MHQSVGHFEFKQDVTAMLSGITDTGQSEIIENVMIGEVSELHPISETEIQEDSHSGLVQEQSMSKLKLTTSRIKKLKNYGLERESLQ